MKNMWAKWIVIFLMSHPAWGFKFTTDFAGGFYWATLPINITVIENDPARKSNLENLSRSAISEWEDETGLSLWSYTGSGTQNIIRWSTNFAAETRMDPRTVLAVAIRYTNGPYFAKTEIVINGTHELNQNNTFLRTTLIHELGHTMGLDHSEVNQAVMAPTLQMWYQGLHVDDVAGMNAAFDETEKRQITRYVTPLSQNREEKQVQPLSCGTLGTPAAQGMNVSGLVSLVGGFLISLVRRFWRKFKSQN